MRFLKAIFVLTGIFFLPLALSAQNYYGGTPALFDDFSYTNVEYPISGDSSNSFYGRNIWLTENGAISSRAWHRYNWGDEIKFGKNSSIEPIPEGITYKISNGFRFGEVTPGVMSGFLIQNGTFISRVRFGSLSPKTFSTQAFWLYSPDGYSFKVGKDTITYVHEVNYEWNNWFFGKGDKSMTANTIWSYHTKDPWSYGSVRGMNFFKKESGKFVQIPTKTDASQEYYTENKWYYYLIRLDSIRQTAEFLAESAEDSPEKIYGGFNIQDGKITPVAHRENFPITPLMTMYNCGISSVGDDSVARQESHFDTDWFYYTPSTKITISEAVAEVKNFKNKGIARINTTGRPTFHDTAAHLEPPSVRITGPDEIPALQTFTWTVRPSLKNTRYFVEYSYRRLSESGTSEWIAVDSPDAVIYARAADNAIEFTSTVKDWRSFAASTTKMVKVIPFKTTAQSDIFPNPTSSLAVITLPESFKKKELKIEIFSLEGKKIEEYTSNEQVYATLDFKKLPAGQYIVIVAADDEVLKTSVTVVR